MASSEPSLSRSLADARAAAKSGDTEASRRAHGAKAEPSSSDGVIIEVAGDGGPDDGAEKQILSSTETHGSGGDFVKSLVFGGLDGIITTFAIIAASQGAGLSQRTIILMGFANLIADAISMGVGDFLSETAEQKYVAGEQRREQWETDNYMEGEVKEMTEIYEQRGMSKDDARDYMAILSKYPKLFLENMMVDELGLMPIKDDDDPHAAKKKGFVTFCAFVMFGAVPVLVYVVEYAVSGGVSDKESREFVFLAACIAAALTMFSLGAVKARITNQGMLESGIWMLVNGSLAAVAAWGVGYLLDKALMGDEATHCGPTL